MTINFKCTRYGTIVLTVMSVNVYAEDLAQTLRQIKDINILKISKKEMMANNIQIRLAEEEHELHLDCQEDRRCKNRRTNNSRISIPNNNLFENNDRRVFNTFL